MLAALSKASSTPPGGTGAAFRTETQPAAAAAFHFDPFLDTMRRELPVSPERSVSEAASPERGSFETTNREVEAAEAEFIGSPVVKFK